MRGGNDRRRSPPPRREDRRFSGPGGGPPPGGPGGWDRRRPRSVSPDRFRRSPPGKRFRRDDYDDYDRHGGRFDRGDGYGGGGWRGGPPPRGGAYDDRYDDRGPPPPRGPLTFVEFVRDLPPHIGPDQANDEYRRYMAGWWGDAIKAEFEERKGDPGLRRRFDPREILRVMQQRNELAQAAAAAFREQLAEGGSVVEHDQSGPGPQGFSEPSGDGERDGAAPPSPPRPPALCWQPAQLAADLALAKQLMQTVDTEKGITENPLLPPAAAAAAAPAAAEGGEAVDGEGGAPAAEVAQGPADMDAELLPEEQLAKLDQVLAYLWQVHGIDFYGGREYTNPAEPGRAAARRTQRGPRPTDAELVAAEEEAAAAVAAKDEAAAAAAAKDEAAKDEAGKEGGGEGDGADAGGETAAEGAAGGDSATVDAVAAGEGGGSPASAPGSADKQQQAVQQQGQQQQQQDGGAAGSGGGGEAEEYERRVTGFWRFRIEKGDPLEGPLQRQRVEDELERFVDSQVIKIEDNKWGNKLSSKLFMGREFVVKHIRNKHGQVLQGERERVQEQVFWENFRAFKQEEQRRQEEEQERVMAGMAAGGRGRGRGMGLPLEAAPMAAINPAGMMMGPIIMPTAGGMAPVILPVDMVMGMGMAAGMGGRRGGRGGMRGPGGRGPRSGGRGGGGSLLLGGAPGAKLDAGGGVREYYDLDAPQNNRAVLDYGDL